MLYLFIVIMVGLDQFIKYVVSQNVELHQIQPVIHGFFSITYYLNSGGAFSFLAEKSWGIFLLSGISIIVSVILLVFIFRFRKRDINWIRFALALLVSGTIGNMIDRIHARAVIDFLMFSFGSYTFPIFNLADMCIVVGSFLLAVLMLFDKKLFTADANRKIDSSSVSLDSEGKNPSNDV